VDTFVQLATHNRPSDHISKAGETGRSRRRWRQRQTVDGGSGRVRVGDSEWIARGPDTPVGTRMRIIGNDGAILLVEPIPLLDDKSEAPA